MPQEFGVASGCRVLNAGLGIALDFGNTTSAAKSSPIWQMGATLCDQEPCALGAHPHYRPPIHPPGTRFCKPSSDASEISVIEQAIDHRALLGPQVVAQLARGHPARISSSLGCLTTTCWQGGTPAGTTSAKASRSARAATSIRASRAINSRGLGMSVGYFQAAELYATVRTIQADVDRKAGAQPR